MAHKAVGPGSLVASRFRLEDLLDEHSGVWLWRATDLTLARNVAVHVIAADDPRAGAVLTAARTSATVTDSRILRVLDALREGDFVHVVHEWGAGMSLDRMLAEEPLDPRRAAWLVREVAEAVGVAHRHGIAHGRLLPENVMLSDAGSVKLIGFVVDVVLRGRPRRAGDDREPPSEHESDVANLGALLYAALTGRWPGFPQSRLPDAPLDHGRICRPRQVRPGVPKRLDLLCDEILHPDAHAHGHHFESAQQFSAALSDYLGDATGPLVAVVGPTAFVDPAALRRPAADGTLGSFDGHPTAAALPTTDPDRTQPGMPGHDRSGFADDDTDPSGAAVPGSGTATTRTASTGGSSQPDDVPEWGPRGSGAGAVPPHWGPDRIDDSGVWPANADDEHPGSTWLRLAALVGVVVLFLLAVVVAFSLGSRETAEDPPTTAGATPTQRAPQPVEVAAVSDFDPDDVGGGENPELARLAVDGQVGSSWETKTYFDGPVLSPYRSGVGLLLDLGQDVEVADVRVTVGGGPYDLQLLAAPPESAPPTSITGLTTVATRSGVSGEVVLEGDRAVTSRYLVVWLTALPPTEGGFRGYVAEVVVRS